MAYSFVLSLKVKHLKKAKKFFKGRGILSFVITLLKQDDLVWDHGDAHGPTRANVCDAFGPTRALNVCDAYGPTPAFNVCDAHGPTRAYDHGDAHGPTRAYSVCDAFGPTRT